MITKTFRSAALAALSLAALLAAMPASAQLQGLNPFCIDLFESNQQPRVRFETQTISADGMTTYLSSSPAVFPPGDSFGPNPPNMVETRYELAETCRGTPIPNTLPSTPEHPYNLHDDPVVTSIDNTSPTDDLDRIMDQLEYILEPGGGKKCKKKDNNCISANPSNVGSLARMAVDIIEGNSLSGDLQGRTYEGFPLLHYLGGLKTKSVDPVTKTVTINQIFFDSHMESDTSYVDPTVVDDEEWKIVYNINVLNRGHEDFAPFGLFFDDRDELDLTDVNGPNLGGKRIPNVAMDQTFFPMEEGQRYTFEMKMPPARFWNLTYHWGWRIHPPRVQVTENVTVPLANGKPRNWAEIGVFGENPRASEKAKLAAIGMIGDLAPAKRMWRMFRDLAEMPNGFNRGTQLTLAKIMPELRQAFYDWQNRNKLPTGFVQSPDVDTTLLFINNTVYGQVAGHDGDAEVRIDKLWNNRGDKLNIQLLNGDYYLHAYVPVDFGGLRGWENIYQNTLPLGGAGPLFTFGRAYWWVHSAGGGPIPIPVATRPPESLGNASATDDMAHGKALMRGKHGNRNDRGDYAEGSWGGLIQEVTDATTATGIGEHYVEITLNYEPSRRLRMYQFDPLHHDVAIWSMH
jgi:hypothetical protein